MRKREIIVQVLISLTLATASIGVFKAVNDHAERSEAREARDQMNRVGFSLRHRPGSEPLLIGSCGKDRCAITEAAR
jgi:hypothetical protein